VPRGYTGEVPAWCRAALERGDEVIVLRLGATLRKRLRRAMAMIEGELRDGRLTALDRLPFEKAETRVKKRRREGYDARRRALIARGTVPVLWTSGGDAMVRLASAESLADEGSRMRHCVGGYSYPAEVASGACEIYSLRDREGRPRATIEVADGRVWQVKGFANGPVGAADQIVLREFIRRRGYGTARRDRRNLDLLRCDFRYLAHELEHDLRAGGGLTLLSENRYAGLGAPTHAEVETLLFRLVVNAGKLAPETRRLVYQAARPEGGRLLRLRRMCAFSPYGIVLHLHRVTLPLAVLNLARFGVFRGTGFESEALLLWRQAESDLVNLALETPERLFALGPRPCANDLPYGLLSCPTDVLDDALVDVSALRDQRHAVLLRCLNQAKRRHLGRRARPAKAHLTVRRLLDDSQGDFVL
jgi:PcfJ-like protein